MTKKHIFVINESTSESIHDSSGDIGSVIGYTAGGADQAVDINSSKCYAKKVTIELEGGIKDKFYIKYDDKGFMYDPWGLYTEGAEDKKLYGDKPTWAFRRTGKKSFYYYLDYLRTRNKAWLRNAEREATDG